MIRTLLATTALAALVASGAYAQNASTPATPPSPAPTAANPGAPVAKAEGNLATNIIGESVYNGTGDNAENIGKVKDILFDRQGQAKQVVIGVGGFLGIGDKNVAFDYPSMQWAEKNGDRWLIAKTTKDELTKQPEFDSTPYKPASNAPVSTSSANNDTSMAPAAGTTADNTTMAPATPQAAPSMAPAGNSTAQNSPAQNEPATTKPITQADGMLATSIIGESVYDGPGDNAQKIGDVNDIVLAKDGKATSMVVGVGGFLGMGEKNVAFDFNKFQWAEKDGNRWLIAQTNKDELQKLPDFDRRAYDPAPASSSADANAPAKTTPTVQTAAGSQPAATAPAPADTTTTAAIDKSTLTEVPADKISADNLIGTTVYGANDANLGKIGDVVLTADNKVDSVVIDVGGFLGIGSKPVAVGMENLKFMADKNGNQYLYTNLTKEQLDAQAAYDKSSYTQQRDKQRMVITR